MFDILTFGSGTQDLFLKSEKFTEIESDKFHTKKRSLRATRK